MIKVSTSPIAANAAQAPGVALPFYFRFKRIIDFVAAAVMIIGLSPLWVLVGLLALLDVGLPILFWQQRPGLNGHYFLLHKIRTLRPPFDWRAEKVPEEQRLSAIGRLLRRTRLDELPQLLNVLVGDMSLIGPRPLLPQDQPPTPTLRLVVRPGITGWAQVNGGALLSPKEKDELDEWYIRNASPWLDLRIAGLTILWLITGSRRPTQTRTHEVLTPNRWTANQERSVGLQGTLARSSPNVVQLRLRDEGRRSAVNQ